MTRARITRSLSHGCLKLIRRSRSAHPSPASQVESRRQCSLLSTISLTHHLSSLSTYSVFPSPSPAHSTSTAQYTYTTPTMKPLSLSLLPLLLLAISDTHAWGPLPHRTIALLSTRFLLPETAAFIRTILPKDETIAAAALWGDYFSHTAEGRWSGQLHYIDAHDDPEGGVCGVEYERDCGEGGMCVVGGIVNVVSLDGVTLDCTLLICLVIDATTPTPRPDPPPPTIPPRLPPPAPSTPPAPPPPPPPLPRPPPPLRRPPLRRTTPPLDHPRTPLPALPPTLHRRRPPAPPHRGPPPRRQLPTRQIRPPRRKPALRLGLAHPPDPPPGPHPAPRRPLGGRALRKHHLPPPHHARRLGRRVFRRHRAGRRARGRP